MYFAYAARNGGIPRFRHSLQILDAGKPAIVPCSVKQQTEVSPELGATRNYLRPAGRQKLRWAVSAFFSVSGGNGAPISTASATLAIAMTADVTSDFAARRATNMNCIPRPTLRR
jgi:hypothetical protein